MIDLDTDCWRDWKHFKGKIEGYIYKAGSHKGVCIRQAGDTEKLGGISCDLFIENGVWKVNMVRCDWRPGRKWSVLKVPGTWNMTKLVSAVAIFGKSFGGWKCCCKNCRQWSSGFINFLQSSSHSALLYFYDVAELQKHIEGLGCNLCVRSINYCEDGHR